MTKGFFDYIVQCSAFGTTDLIEASLRFPQFSRNTPVERSFAHGHAGGQRRLVRAESGARVSPGKRPAGYTWASKPHNRHVNLSATSVRKNIDALPKVLQARTISVNPNLGILEERSEPFPSPATTGASERIARSSRWSRADGHSPVALGFAIGKAYQFGFHPALPEQKDQCSRGFECDGHPRGTLVSTIVLRLERRAAKIGPAAVSAERSPVCGAITRHHSAGDLCVHGYDHMIFAAGGRNPNPPFIAGPHGQRRSQKFMILN